MNAIRVRPQSLHLHTHKVHAEFKLVMQSVGAGNLAIALFFHTEQQQHP